jgi:CRP-like cAMP-binding protein
MKSKEINLYNINAFNNISNESIEKLKKILNIKELKKKEMLFFEKDVVTNVYMIYLGKVSLFRINQNGQRRIIYILDAGEIINEVIFDDLPASISCEGFENSIILEFNKEKLLEIMKDDFVLTQNIMNSMGRKIRRLYRQIKNTIPMGMDKKIAAKLWKLSKDYGTNCCNSQCENHFDDCECKKWTRLDIKISVTYLADMLGSSRETVSREMTKLKNLNLIKWKENKKLVVNREALLKYYRDL